MIIGIAVAIAIAAVAPGLGAALAGFLHISTTVAVALVTVGLTLVAGIAMKALGLTVGTPKAKNAVGPPSIFRQSITDSFLVYGKRRVGGLIVFFHASQSGNDHFRYFVVAVAGHSCEGVVSWMLNDEIVTVNGSNMVTSGPYASGAWLWFQEGADSETANATFVSECGGKWTSNHKGNKTTAIYAKFKMTDAVVQAGMPNFGAIIEGKNDILDTRDDTEGYTNNASLVFYDWMKLPREEGGFGAYADEIPNDTFIDAQANVCDETIESEPRYALDAVIVTGAAPNEIRDVMIVNCAGSFTYSSGKFLMRPGYWIPSTETLSEHDLAGPIQVSAFLSGDQSANQVQGTYISPTDNYQGAAFGTQAVVSDEIRQLDLDLAFVTSKYRAERIARIMLNRAQCEKSVVWPMNITGLKVQALDTVQLTSDRYGLSNYAFKVEGWALSPDWGVVLNLREENEDIYADPTPVVLATPPAIVQATPFAGTGEVQAAIRSSAILGLTKTGSDVSGSGVITISEHTRDYPSPYGDLVIEADSLTGFTLTGSEQVLYLYYDDATLLDTTPTIMTTTDPEVSLNSATNPYRHDLGQVVLPATGGPPNDGYGGGGYGGYYNYNF